MYYWKTVLFWWEKYQKYQKQNMKDKIKKKRKSTFQFKNIIVYDKKSAAWVSLFQENNVPKNEHLSSTSIEKISQQDYCVSVCSSTIQL